LTNTAGERIVAQTGDFEVSRFSIPVRQLPLAAATAILTLAGVVLSAHSRPLTPAEHRHSSYSGNVPACSDPSVLNRIQRRFSRREHIYWRTGKEILHFYRARQIGYRSNGLDFIPKRYCTIRARFNDGRKRRITYSIGEDLGMAGWGWGVEWCVHGLDYNYAYAPGCKAARP
jgi:hypothetical protein